MKKKLMLVITAFIGAAAIYGAYYFQTSRMTPLRLAQIQKAQQGLEAVKGEQGAQDSSRVAEAAEKSAAQPASSASSAAGAAEGKEKAMTPSEDGKTPEAFKVKFETSKGDVLVECRREWAPNGVDHFYELVKAGFYNKTRFFRVVKQPRPFVVQFGINGDPQVMAQWRKNIQDDPVKESNVRGTLTFAAGQMPNSRSTQLFINLNDNTPLDRMRFAVIGKVLSGMEAVDAITGEYGEQPDQGMIQERGNEYLNAAFPNLDYVKKATIVE